MTFRKDCRFLGGYLDLNPSGNRRICGLTAQLISSCEGCNLFQSVHVPCDICEIFQVCHANVRKTVTENGTKEREPIVVSKFSSPPKRHMLYHLWPNYENDVWNWNIQHILAYLDIFEGVRSVAVVVDNKTHTLDTVKKAFGDVRIDNWIELPNDPRLRECSSFIPLMESVPRGENDITWYGHGKGVRHSDASVVPLVWSHVQYRLTLENLAEVDRQLQDFPITGCFKRHDEFKLPKHHLWHYSGTFFWFRNKYVFENNNWHDLAPNFFAGVEAWPSRIFFDGEGGCLFGDSPGDLYSLETWKRLQPSLRAHGIEIDLE